MSEHKEQPIIIKKKKIVSGHGHHGGAWKVAYADFVTAMMAFFLVMWILGLSPDTKKSIAQYFQNPGVLPNPSSGNTPLPPIFNQAKVKHGEGKGGVNDITQELLSELKDSVRQNLINKAKSDSAKAEESVREVAHALNNFIEREKQKSPEMKELLDHVVLDYSKEGIRIEMVESRDKMFFEVGSARLTQKANTLLRYVGQQIARLPNNVEIEGHTDARGYASETGYSNWELSTDRANSARKILTASGLWDGQVSSVKGFADRHLRLVENPFDLSNRRVSILIPNLKSEEFLSMGLSAEVNTTSKVSKDEISPSVPANGISKKNLTTTGGEHD